MPSYAKAVTFDDKTLFFVEELQKELNIRHFSQALRIAITYARSYKESRHSNEHYESQILILNKELNNLTERVNSNTKTFREIKKILKSRQSNKQKVDLLKELL